MNFKVGDVLIWDTNKDMPCTVVSVNGDNVTLSWKSPIDDSIFEYTYKALSLFEAIGEGSIKLERAEPLAVFSFKGKSYQASDVATARKLLDMLEIQEGLDKQFEDFSKL